MKFKALRLTSLLAAFALVAGGWATSALATDSGVYSLSGNSRAQIGNGLPIPITGTPAPNGRILPITGATVMQPPGPAPRRLLIAPGQLTAPGNPVNIAVYPANPAVFQVKTAITISAPGAAFGTASFKASGRTGGPVYTYCANNPGCGGPGDGGNAINGLMRYTKTTNQFGGPSQANAGGSADVGIVAGAGAPCAFLAPNPGCLAIMALATPNATGAQGGAFGFVNGTAGMAPPSGLLAVTVTPNGSITNVVGLITTGMMVTPTGTGPPLPGLPNPATSYGGPYTTGMLTISVTQNLGATSEVFTITGSDMRVSGVGSISLVAGSVSNRALTGPNANRSWLNLTIGPEIPLTPTMSNHGIAAFVGLLALAGGYLLHRRMTA